MTQPLSSVLARRRVLTAAGSAGALAAVAACVPTHIPTASTANAPSGSERPDGGYQLTQHVLRYYQTARV